MVELFISNSSTDQIDARFTYTGPATYRDRPQKGRPGFTRTVRAPSISAYCNLKYAASAIHSYHLELTARLFQKSENIISSSKRPHYRIEQRYKSALNERFRALQACLVRTFLLDDDEARTPREQQLLATVREWQCNSQAAGVRQDKSSVLQAAIDYIKWLQSRCETRSMELEELETAITVSGHRLSTTLSLA